MILYTDSMCSLHWLNAASNKFEKMQKRSVFIMNRLNYIQKLCNNFTIHFCFISGKNNPADCITRSFSYKQLIKTNYLSGPSSQDINSLDCGYDEISVIIPSPFTTDFNLNFNDVPSSALIVNQIEVTNPIVDPMKFSSFHRLLKVSRRVLMCVDKWKSKAQIATEPKPNYTNKALKLLLSADQANYFPEVCKFFNKKNPLKGEIPPIVCQLNVYKDSEGIFRVKSKFRKWNNSQTKFPILLSKFSHLSKLIILDIHKKLNHSGCYSVLAELRNSYYIPHQFSAVKKVLNQCIHCKRFNAKTIKLNQGGYREFRSNPPKTPFANIFIDHLGPFFVTEKNKKIKLWLLCITCTWSRAINLKISRDLTVDEFLKGFQLHCFEYGVPELCISDLGTQFQAGANIISNFLNDPFVDSYLEENNIKPLTFQNYFKGHSELGSLVESCVKLVKRLVFGSIKNRILPINDFEFLICNVIHLVNRRPIAFKESLRDNDPGTPDPITPEMLVKGYRLNSINLIPSLHPVNDPSWNDKEGSIAKIRDSYSKLRNAKEDLEQIYWKEFMGTLVSQAVDKKDRYRPVVHKGIKKGDIVLIKEKNFKPNHYPMGIVREVIINNLGEITNAVIMKGSTRESVKRHVSTLIPILEDTVPIKDETIYDSPDTNLTKLEPKPTRKAAVACRERIKNIFSSDANFI